MDEFNSPQMNEAWVDGQPDPFNFTQGKPEVEKPQGLKDPPENDPLAEKWGERIERTSRHYEKFFKRCKHNRKVVAGFNWKEDPASEAFIQRRANLIQGTITTLMPTIYARNPEIEVRPSHPNDPGVAAFASTLEKVTNRMLEDANLKRAAKGAVRAALTTSIGAIKVVWQDTPEGPIPSGRIEDSQDNVEHINGLVGKLADPTESANGDALKEELKQTMAAVHEKAEVTAAYGVVVDRVMIDNLLIDPAVENFEDYAQAKWIAQAIPMRRGDAEAKFGYKLGKAKKYSPPGEEDNGTTPILIASGKPVSVQSSTDDDQIIVYEIWDKGTQRVYTMAQGCRWWLREPFSPEGVGERWYPFFLLPYQVVDGTLIGPSLVDLCEKLQDEHNEARDDFKKYRELCKPGYIASAEVKPAAGKAFIESQIGDLVFLDLDGDQIQKAIQPKSLPQVPTAVFDTGQVQQDWEMVSGMQDASRSAIVKAKTATEAKIMQNSQSGRVSEFVDQVEDWLKQIARYTSEMLLQHLTDAQVQRIMGTEEYQWPQMLAKEDVFFLVDVNIRAGSTGKPDKAGDQEVWGQLLPTVSGLIDKIMQLGMQGADVKPYIYLLQQTVTRFDESIDWRALIPNLQAMMQQQMAAQQAAQQAQAQAVPQQGEVNG